MGDYGGSKEVERGKTLRLPADSVIAIEKMTDYLLRPRPENDKSQFMALAGYTHAHGDQLAADIRAQLLPLDAKFQETTE